MTTNVDENTTVKAVFERASAMLRAGDMQMAESLCRNGLALFPGDGNLLTLFGGVLIRLGRAAEAEAPLRSVIGRFPDFAKAQEELGNAMLAQRRLADASRYLQRALELEPGNAQTSFKLEKVRGALGRNEDTLGGDVFEELLARNPADPDVYRIMGNEAVAAGQLGDAIVLLQKSVSVDPAFAVGWIDLAKAHSARGDFTAALDAARQAASLEPDAPLPHILGAAYLYRLGRYVDAIEAYNAGLAADPGNLDCLLGIGHALRTIGRHDSAAKVYREAIRSHPLDAAGYWSLANLKSVRFEPAEVEQLRERAALPDLPDEERAQFLFALGKAYEDDADYAQSFACYKAGNSVHRKLETYDPVATQTAFDDIIEVFDAALLDARAAQGDPDPAPIFIVGLPRSGSTLIEQILASHSKVDGTRELVELEQLVTAIKTSGPGCDAYPQALRGMPAAEFAALGRQYLEATRRYRARGTRFTDKMPTNFRHIGLLHLVLPNARIINARRHPLDSCLGSFKQLFAQGQPYSYDLFELGDYYMEYQRLMDHWHAVLPGRVLDVHYEALIHAPEQQIRRLLDYCELDWEDACLHFHATDRPIESASSAQVRRPLYTTSVNNWRNYEEQLGELIDILLPLLVELPEEQRPAALR